MFKKIHVALASTVLMASMVSTQAFAAKPDPTPVLVGCADSTVTTGNAGYIACLGPFDKNMDNQLTAIYGAMTTGLSFTTSTYFASNVATTGNPFAGAPDTTTGTITFTAAQTGSFVIGLKQSDAYSLYKFDGSTVTGGITSIQYDILGVNGKSGFDLSHAGFFGTPVSPVPEADTYAMLLAGLGIVGFAARRRKAK